MKIGLRVIYFFIILLTFYSCNTEEEPSPILSPLENAYVNSEIWNWIPKEEMLTRAGFTTGYGANFNKNSTKLIIYLDGGGACFNEITCFLNSFKFDEMDFDELINSSGSQGSVGIFNRNSTNNPFKDWNFVYVPYVTGDVHSGNNPSADIPNGLSNQKMVGYNNITEVLKDVSPFFEEKGISEVFLSGASAGGYGTLINYNQVAEYFPELDISMIADSSPMFTNTDIYPNCLNERFETTFNFQLPSDYSQYTSDTYPYRSQRIYEYLSRKYPDAQFGFFSYYADETIRYFFGFGAEDCADGINPISEDLYLTGLTELAESFEDFENWKVYFENGSSHTILFSSEFETLSVSDKKFTDWLKDLNNKEASSFMR